VDAKVTEGSEKSEKFEEAKKKLDWVEEWIVAKDRWGWQGSEERLFIARFLDRDSEK
jgi:hypothetical protein